MTRMSDERFKELANEDFEHMSEETLIGLALEIRDALKAERQSNEGNARLLNAEMEHSEKMRQRAKAAEAKLARIGGEVENA